MRPILPLCAAASIKAGHSGEAMTPIYLAPAFLGPAKQAEMIIIDAISESALPAIAKIEAELFETPLSLPALKSLFDGPAFTGLISFENASLAGYLLAHLTQDQLEILSLGTA